MDSPLLANLKGYCGGEWIAAQSGKTLSVSNPATGEALAEVPSMGEAETLRSIGAASAALARPTTIAERRSWLERIADLQEEHRDELARIITLEQGKPLAESRGEVDYSVGFFRYAAKHVDALAPHELEEKPRGHSWTVYYRPAGVVALITPWNFPLAMQAKKLSAAIAADCPSVIRPSSKTPLTMVAFFSLLEQAGLPPGQVNLVIGPAGKIGDLLCAHPDVRVVSFTGSTGVGKKLIEGTADQVKKLALELGGNAPYIVFDDADLDSAADHLIANKFRGAGQTCVCANRVYADKSIAEAFSAKIVERVKKLRVGNGLEEGTDIGPLIDRRGFEKVKRHLEDALARGARLEVGEVPETPATDWGCFFPPAVLRGVTQDMACVREETFGPLVPVIEFSNENEVVDCANDTEFGLAAYVFTADGDRAARVISRLSFGHVGLNTGTGPTPEAPFGGMKQSGFGREGGLEGLLEFVEAQTVPSA